MHFGLDQDITGLAPCSIETLRLLQVWNNLASTYYIATDGPKTSSTSQIQGKYS